MELETTTEDAGQTLQSPSLNTCQKKRPHYAAQGAKVHDLWKEKGRIEFHTLQYWKHVPSAE